MKLENEYLSDEELTQLIYEIEKNELVMAPPDFTESVLESIKPKNNKNEFTTYCFRVFASVAAAIVLLFIMPETAYTQTQKIPTKQEVLGAMQYASKEEVLDESSLLTKLLGSIRTWNKNKETDYLIDENGG